MDRFEDDGPAFVGGKDPRDPEGLEKWSATAAGVMAGIFSTETLLYLAPNGMQSALQDRLVGKTAERRLKARLSNYLQRRALAAAAAKNAGKISARVARRLSAKAAAKAAKSAAKFASIPTAVFEISQLTQDLGDIYGYLNPAYNETIVFETVENVAFANYNVSDDVDDFSLDDHPDLKAKIRKFIDLQIKYYAITAVLDDEPPEPGTIVIDFNSPTFEDLDAIEESQQAFVTGGVAFVVALLAITT